MPKYAYIGITYSGLKMPIYKSLLWRNKTTVPLRAVLPSTPKKEKEK